MIDKWGIIVTLNLSRTNIVFKLHCTGKLNLNLNVSMFHFIELYSERYEVLYWFYSAICAFFFFLPFMDKLLPKLD